MRFEIHTQRREQMIDITAEVRQTVERESVDHGMVLIYCPHTTAAVTVNESADPDVPADVLAGLALLAPAEGAWRHSEGNADAHLKAALIGASVAIPIIDGKLALGTWQGIFLCEFDGPRTRSLIVSACTG